MMQHINEQIRLKTGRRKATRRASGKAIRKGATALEFAIVAPVLFLVILTCFEFAKLAMMQSLAETAAYEACRFAVVEGSSTSDATNEAQRILSRLGTQNATITVNNGAEVTALDRDITVRVRIPMDDNAFLLSSLFSDQFIETEITLGTERYTGYYDGGDDDDED